VQNRLQESVQKAMQRAGLPVNTRFEELVTRLDEVLSRQLVDSKLFQLSSYELCPRLQCFGQLLIIQLLAVLRLIGTHFDPLQTLWLEATARLRA